MELDHFTITPLYVQLKQNIQEAINQGIYKQGQKLPNEIKLGEIFGVSRITVRRAIQELVDEEFLVRRQGKGTFVI